MAPALPLLKERLHPRIDRCRNSYKLTVASYWSMDKPVRCRSALPKLFLAPAPQPQSGQGQIHFNWWSDVFLKRCISVLTQSATCGLFMSSSIHGHEWQLLPWMTEEVPRQHFSDIKESRSGLPSELWENAGSCALFVCPPRDGVPPRRLPAYKRFGSLFVCFSLSRLA